MKDTKDKEIEVYINGEKVDITNIYEPLKQGEYFYKENGKWYVHKLKNVSFVIEEDKKIEKLPYYSLEKIQKAKNKEQWYEERISLLEKRIENQHDKINEIIEVLNERNI